MTAHPKEFQLRLLALIALCFVVGGADPSAFDIARAADKRVIIQGQILSESGIAPTPTVMVNGVRARLSNEGRFEVTVEPQDVYCVDVKAAGHYGMIHCFGHAELKSAKSHDAGEILPITLVAKKTGRVLMAFAGDAMIGRRYSGPLPGEPVLVRTDRKASDTKSILRHIKPYFELADFATINLETQIIADTPRESAQKKFIFHSPPEMLDALQWAGIDHVNLGNNHVYDYLEEGLSATFAALEARRLGYSGAGHNEPDALAAYRTQLGGAEYSFLGYVGWKGGSRSHQAAEGAEKGGAALGTSNNMQLSLGRERRAGRIPIVQYHGSVEYSDEPTLVTESRLKSAIDAGAALGIAHHPHVLQGFEVYKGQLIAYSLGNIVFDQFLYAAQPSVLLYVWLDKGKFHKAEVVPFHIKGYVPTPATGAMRNHVLSRLAKLSARRGAHLSVSGGHGLITSEHRNRDTESVFPVRLPATGSGKQIVRLNQIPWHTPIDRVEVKPETGLRYRLGHDLLVRGDFESHRTFGVTDRTWIEDSAIEVVSDVGARGGRNAMRLRMDAGNDKVTAGMRRSVRVFGLGNPMTISGAAFASVPARLHLILLSHPRNWDSARILRDGKRELLESVTLDGDDWTSFAGDYNSPRDADFRFRFLLVAELENPDASGDIFVDDLALIEWQTPYMATGTSTQRTHRRSISHLEVLGAWPKENAVDVIAGR